MSNEKPNDGGKILRHEFGAGNGKKEAVEKADEATVLPFEKEKPKEAPGIEIALKDLEFLFGQPGVEIRPRQGKDHIFDRWEGDTLLGSLAVIPDVDGGTRSIIYEYGAHAGRKQTEIWDKEKIKALFTERTHEKVLARKVFADLEKVFGNKVRSMEFVGAREGRLIFGEFVGADMISDMEVALDAKGDIRHVMLEDEFYEKGYIDGKLGEVSGE